MRGLVINKFTNRIEYATHNGKGLITGKREDVTDIAVDLVFEHLKKEFEKHNEKEVEKITDYGFSYGSKGYIKYIP